MPCGDAVLSNLLWFVYPELMTCEGMDADPANDRVWSLGQNRGR